jgi:hypothetical protein
MGTGQEGALVLGWLRLAEPDVALTDFALALVALLCAAGLPRGPEHRSALRPWLVVFYQAEAVAAAVGGTVHGFFPDPESPGNLALWPVTLAATGLTALAEAQIATALLFAPPRRRMISAVVWGVTVLYLLAVALGARSFALAVAAYLAATALLLVSLVRLARRTGARPAYVGLAAIGLAVVGAVVQRYRLQIPGLPLTYNAVYHLIQAASLWLFSSTAAWLVRRGFGGEARTSERPGLGSTGAG